VALDDLLADSQADADGVLAPPVQALEGHGSISGDRDQMIRETVMHKAHVNPRRNA
jgi:hypothetical protein